MNLDTQTLLLVLMVVSLVALGFSIYVNVFLLKWRKSVSSNDVSIVPSELLQTLEKQKKSLKKSAKDQNAALAQVMSDLAKIFQGLQQQIGSGAKASGELLEAFTGLQTALDEKDSEIKRLRNGYDAEIFRRFVTRFLRIDRIIAEEIEDASPENEEMRSVLDELHTLMKDALLDCGLEQFTPEVGQSIREADGVDENFKSVPAPQPEQALTIAEVLTAGWRIPTPAGFDYIKKARVAVYVAATEG